MIVKPMTVAFGALALIAYAIRRTLIARWLGLTPAVHDVLVERAVHVPMPDGAVLVADHYHPRARGAYPTILMRTPYGRDARGAALGLFQLFVSQRFAERGYHVVVQDTRGRFDSGGEFEPFVDEERDGLATLDWISRQSWFDGSIGMWGQSYLGYVQWAVASQAPDSLKAIVPCAAGSQLTPYSQGVFAFDAMLRWLDILNPRDGLVDRFRVSLQTLLDPVQQTRALAPVFSHLPVGDADRLLLRRTVPYFQEWLENDHVEAPYWKSVHYGKDMRSIRAATCLVSGWYDMLLHQLLRDYRAMVEAGRSPYLTIGPWRHLDIGSALESLRAGINWLDGQLKGKQTALRKRPVRVFLMGANEWREFDSWPPPAQERRYYLCDHFTLGDTPLDSPPEHYRYDPADPTPSVGGPVYHQDGGVKDNRELEARRDVLCYTSEPLQEPLDVIGPVKLELYVRSSLDTADFFGRLCDVRPDGRSLNVCDGLFRLERGKQETLADGSARIVVDMWATAQRFVRGHRLRLQVSSGAHPRYNRNLGTGEPLVSATRTLAAEQTIHHDPAHPSALVVPCAVRNS